MKTLIKEIQAFLKKTGMPACDLAKKANVSPALLSRILNGQQKDVRFSTALSIKEAMRKVEDKDTHHAT